jgi:hypothetical protein
MPKIIHFMVTHWGAIVTIGATLASYHVGSAFVDTLPMPNTKSTQFYRFAFAFCNRIAANYNRAKAANGPAGQKAPQNGEAAQ